MKKYSLTVFSILLGLNLYSQTFIFWGNLGVGNYQVGYQDTIVFNSQLHYSFHSYSGDKPYFISIWFPIEKKRDKTLLLYKNYFEYDYTQSTKVVRDSLMNKNIAAFLEYGITNNLDTWENTEVTLHHQKLKDQVFQTEVNAIKSKFNLSKQYPTVIYHHGSGGTAEENSVLFELLASNGFIVVSSNYHWPIISEEIVNNGKLEEVISDAKFVVDWAIDLPFSNPEFVYFLGHSWGAQTGLILNHRQINGIKKYLLLDSTLEGMPVSWIKKYYPHLDSIFYNYPNSFNSSTSIITSRSSYMENGQIELNPSPTFEFFKLLDTDNFMFYILKNPLNHDSFLSQGVIRSVYLDEFSQPDSTRVTSQYETFLDLNRFILSLLNERQPETSGYANSYQIKD